MTFVNDRQRGSMAFIAVGSNIDPVENIASALISLTKKVNIKSSSTFYQTEPIGSANQPEFINGLWLIETRLGPLQIRDDVLRSIERELGRVRTSDKFAPRVIDLDLILYDDLVVDDGGFCLPHPDIVRPFVLIPVLELLEDFKTSDKDAIVRLLPVDRPHTAPGQVLPALTQKLRDLLINC